jgi:hypothetical protein
MVFDGVGGVGLRHSSFMPSRKGGKKHSITDTCEVMQAIQVSVARTQNLQSLNCCAPHNN